MAVLSILSPQSFTHYPVHLNALYLTQHPTIRCDEISARICHDKSNTCRTLQEKHQGRNIPTLSTYTGVAPALVWLCYHDEADYRQNILIRPFLVTGIS